MVGDRWVVIPNLDFFDDNEGKETINGKINELKGKIVEIEDEVGFFKFTRFITNYLSQLSLSDFQKC